MPAPRWVQISPFWSLSLTEREEVYLDCALMKIAGNRAGRPDDRDPALLDWTDADLWHFALGVNT
jgi:hypothetical protein